ncbi:hypothetical protein TNIN_66641 [Trichonephila inaurata madagascariensis]|uniref:Uncharacterized protein n=1 Tax=Trichonephila inaurata madagascariensis TaxID=2747483 RepID=A0A8X6WZF6_9ARAC|nr:hypothetical protein TNIN_66641 [Trichonephila inaurata madagascariensis]
MHGIRCWFVVEDILGGDASWRERNSLGFHFSSMRAFINVLKCITGNARMPGGSFPYLEMCIPRWVRPPGELAPNDISSRLFNGNCPEGNAVQFTCTLVMTNRKK